MSGPAHLPVLTGVHPGRANLPGIRWAERPANGNFLGRTRSYMSPFRAWKVERDVPPSVTTLFQHIDGMADVNTWFVRGCAPGGRRTRLSKPAAFLRSLASKDWYASDGQAENEVLSAFDAGFSSVFAVFPAIDELGHRFGPLCEESYESYRRFDHALGRMIDALARRHRLDQTLIAITSDHGQSTTHTHFELDSFVARTYPRTLSYPKLWRNVFSPDAAVMVSGNAMANIYLPGPDGWRDRPDVERDARAVELVGRLLAEEAIDQVICRSGTGYTVKSAAGKAYVEPLDDGVGYRIDGQDPFGYGPLPPTMAADEVARLTIDTDYPDAPWQIACFFRSPRAGDLVVCARPGFDLRDHFEYQPHRGSHGGLHREHMLIPAAVTAQWLTGQVRSVDLFPTILHTLGKPIPPNIDGAALALVRPQAAVGSR